MYTLYRKSGFVQNFEDLLNSKNSFFFFDSNWYKLIIIESQNFLNLDVFKPLFEVAKDPTSHPNLFRLCEHIIGFDSVDDESKASPRLSRGLNFIFQLSQKKKKNQ